MTKVQEFLRGGGTLAQLAERYAVKHKRHGEHPNLVLLKYDQISSPFADPLVRECRGIILDEADNWRVVARAFDKFFNHGEGHAAPIDWKTARVQEKVDGSLCMLYWYDGKWHVATTGTPDGSGNVHGGDMTFAELFWRTFKDMRLKLPHEHDESWQRHRVSFVFELTSPLNRVVVRHSEARLTLLAARQVEGAHSFDPEYQHPELQVRHLADMYPVVREHPLQSFEDVLATFQHLDPLASEGYVVVDDAFRRVKVKHPGYVALHQMKGDGMTDKRALEVVRAGETAEVLAAFPEYAEDFRRVGTAYESLITELEAAYEAMKGEATQKDFALRAVKTRCSAALFSVRSGKAPSIREFLRTFRVENLMEILGLKPSTMKET